MHRMKMPGSCKIFHSRPVIPVHWMNWSFPLPQVGPLYLLGMALTGLGWATTGIADGSARLQIESFEPGVGGARLKASLRGELFYHQSPNTRPIPHRKISLDLTIDTELVRN